MTSLNLIKSKAPDQKGLDQIKVISLRNKLFTDQIQSLEDTKYWEDFSIIRPEEDLKKAITKIIND